MNYPLPRLITWGFSFHRSDSAKDSPGKWPELRSCGFDSEFLFCILEMYYSITIPNQKDGHFARSCILCQMSHTVRILQSQRLGFMSLCGCVARDFMILAQWWGGYGYGSSMIKLIGIDIYICLKKIRAFRIYPWYIYIYIHLNDIYIYNYIHDILIYDILIYDILCKYVCSNPQKDGKVVCYCFGEILSFCLSGGYEMLQIQSLIAESSINEMVNFP